MPRDREEPEWLVHGDWEGEQKSVRSEERGRQVWTWIKWYIEAVMLSDLERTLFAEKHLSLEQTLDNTYHQTNTNWMN